MPLNLSLSNSKTSSTSPPFLSSKFQYPSNYTIFQYIYILNSRAWRTSKISPTSTDRNLQRGDLTIIHGPIARERVKRGGGGGGRGRGRNAETRFSAKTVTLPDTSTRRSDNLPSFPRGCPNTGVATRSEVFASTIVARYRWSRSIRGFVLTRLIFTHDCRCFRGLKERKEKKVSGSGRSEIYRDSLHYCRC